MTQETLYRFYDSSGCLLYIGISKHWPDRLVQHRRDKPWFSEIAHVRLENYQTRAAVEQAEREAISDEKPLYNVHHNGLTQKLQGLDLASKLKISGRADRVIQPGHFVALGLYGQECPVGKVVAVDECIWLRPKSFITGNYDMPLRGYRNDDVRRVVFAEIGQNGEVDDAHLTHFQNVWTSR